MKRVAYVMSRFPHLPETFILREMNELERIGWQISLYPLILQKQEVAHDTVAGWLKRANYYSLLSSPTIKANIESLFRRPWDYIRLFSRCIWENRFSLNFLIRAIFLFPKAMLMARLMSDEGIEHIHAHYATHPALVAWIIHQLTGISYSITVHAHDIFVRTSMLETKLQESAFVISISNYNREYLARVVGSWIEQKISIVHCGIEPSNYKYRSNWTGETGLFEIVNVGSLQPYKGQIFLIWACSILRDRNIPFRCRIIGEGGERPGLEKMIAKNQLQDSVELLGGKPQNFVASFLPKAHCYVQPSIIASSGKMEGIPVALMEAMACGIPVVATSISGIPELVIPEKTGYLVPPSNATALADALELVYKDSKRAARIGKAGHEFVLKEYDLHTNVERLAALFDQVTKNTSKPFS